MLEQKTVLDRIEVFSNGGVHVRFKKCICKNGTKRAHEYHRCTLETKADLKKVRGEVDQSLESIGDAPTQGNDWAKIEEVCRAVQGWSRG
jgi:hypothetical protein